MPVYNPPTTGSISAGTTKGTLGEIILSNSNGISFGIDGQTVTASHNALTSQSGQAFSAQGGSSAFQTLSFNNANGISFSNAAGAVEASYTVPTVPAQLSVGFSTGGNTAGDTGLVTGRMVLVGSNNITLSGSTNAGSITISISGGAGAAGNTGYLSAGGNTASLGTIVLSDSNGISFGANGQTITASYTVPTVTNSTLTVSDAATSIGIARLAFTNSNGLTLSLSTTTGGSATVIGSYTVPTQSNQSVGLYGVGNTTQNSSTTLDARTLSFGGRGDITVGYSNGTVQISGSQSVQTQSVIAGVYDGANSISSGTVRFSNANGVSFGINGQTLTASHNGITSQTAQSVGLYGVGNTTQNSSTTLDARTLSFNGLGGMTVGFSNGSIQLSAPTTAAQTNQTVGLYGVGNTTQNSSTTLDARTLSFGGRGDITVGFSNGTVQISGSQSVQGLSGYAQSNTTQSSSGTLNATSLMFAGAGAASVGVSNGSIVISAPNAGAGNVTVSAGTASAGLASVVFSNSNGVSFGLNGSTITAALDPPMTWSGYNPYPDLPWAVGQVGQGTLNIDPFDVPDMQHDRIVFAIYNSNATNSSGSHTVSLWAGVYSKNASTLSLVGSISTSTAVTHSGTVGSYSLFSGIRLLTAAWTATLTQGAYYLGVLSRTTSGGANGSYSQVQISNLNSNFLGHFGSSHNTTYQVRLGQGVMSVTTNGMPNSIAFTDIRGSDSNALRAPFVYFASGTV